jgi:hypothetical protein
MSKKYFLLYFILLTLISCKNEIKLNGRDNWLIGTNIDSFVQGQTSSKLNLIWVIDNSGSMSNEQTLLSNNFESFINTFAGSAIHYKMGITTTDMSFSGEKGEFVVASGADPLSFILSSAHDPAYVIDNFKENVIVGIRGSGHEKGLSAALAAINASEDSTKNNFEFIEEDSHVAVVIVSDEDERSSADDLNLIIEELKVFKYEHAQKFSLYPVIDITNPRNNANYLRAVEELGGTVFDLYSDFGSSLTFLGNDIVALLKRFTLSKVPIPETINVEVNGVIIETGWFYDETHNSIEFDLASTPENGARINVGYETSLKK